MTNIASAQVASGGQYVLDEAVMANGGGNLNGGVYKVQGTAGNPNSSRKLTGGIYIVQGGFNNRPQFVPTVAELSISGQVVTTKGRGISNVIVILTGGLMTSPKATRTNQFGFFQFNEIGAGHFYAIQVQHREVIFDQPTQSFILNEDRKDFIFRAINQ